MDQELRFDTGQIGPLREALRGLSAVKHLVAVFVQFRVVVDANCVLQNLIYRVRHPDRGATALEEMIKATVIEVHAPRWLESEMTSAIPQVAVETGLAEATLWERWSAFRLLLRWDDSLCAPEPAAPGCRDPKDLPYVALERKLAADGILSQDADIETLGGHPLKLDFVLSARDYARAAVTTVSIRFLGTVVPAASMMLIGDAVRRIIRAFASLPPLAKAVIVAGVAGALLHPQSRKWITERLLGACSALGPAWVAIAELVRILATRDAEAQLRAVRHLEKARSDVRSRRATVDPRMPARRRRSTSIPVAPVAIGARVRSLA